MKYMVKYKTGLDVIPLFLKEIIALVYPRMHYINQNYNRPV